MKKAKNVDGMNINNRVNEMEKECKWNELKLWKKESRIHRWNGKNGTNGVSEWKE